MNLISLHELSELIIPIGMNYLQYSVGVGGKFDNDHKQFYLYLYSDNLMEETVNHLRSIFDGFDNIQIVVIESPKVHLD